MHDKTIQLVIGAETGFEGLDLIKRNYCAVVQDLPFFDDLESTCGFAVRFAVRFVRQEVIRRKD